ncbi:MAG: hypothetical protein DRP33_01185 [Thermotogae bacterium]|nr:MAG: hypothetical protein DRP33_01185 [Thermotogota bacterium]
MSKKRATSILFACFFIFFGVMLLFNVSWNYTWPTVLLFLGLAFEIGLLGKGAGVLIPGGLLLTLGVFFYYNAFTDYKHMSILWPVFILAPGVGLFQFYLKTKDRGSLISSGILAVISAVFIGANLTNLPAGRIIIGGILIFAGILVLIRLVRKG